MYYCSSRVSPAYLACSIVKFPDSCFHCQSYSFYGGQVPARRNYHHLVLIFLLRLGVISYMNAFPVRTRFLGVNACVRNAWATWYAAYLAANIDAPNKANINVPNLYDNWINHVIGNMGNYVRGQVQRYIALVTDNTLADLTLSSILDEKALSVNLNGNPINNNDQVAEAKDVSITRSDLTGQIFSVIGDINVSRVFP